MAASAASSPIACSILAGVLSALPSRSRPLSRHSGCHHRSPQAVPHPVSTAMLPNTRGRPQQSITQTEPGTRKLLMGGKRRHVSVLTNPLVLVCTSAPAISQTVQHLLRSPLRGPLLPSQSFGSLRSPDAAARGSALPALARTPPGQEGRGAHALSSQRSSQQGNLEPHSSTSQLATLQLL